MAINTKFYTKESVQACVNYLNQQVTTLEALIASGCGDWETARHAAARAVEVKFGVAAHVSRKASFGFNDYTFTNETALGGYRQLRALVMTGYGRNAKAHKGSGETNPYATAVGAGKRCKTAGLSRAKALAAFLKGYDAK